MKKFFSFFLMMFSVMAFAATKTTVYYAVPSDVVGDYTVKLNVNFRGDGDAWENYVMTLTDLKYNEDPVYTSTFTDLYDGVGVMQFQLYDGNDWKSQAEVISSWTTPETYNGKMYVHATGKWEAVPSEGGETPEEPVDSMTVYYVNSANWEAVSAYVWVGEDGYKAWPGEAMEKTELKAMEKDVYSYKFPAKYTSIIFNNGGDKTSDLNWDEAKPYYCDGEWYASIDDIKPIVAAKFYLTGDSAFTIDAGLELAKKWSSSAIKVTEDSYEVSLKAGQLYMMVMTIDGSWETKTGYNELVEKPAGVSTDENNNIIFTLAEAGKVKVTKTEDGFKVEGNFYVEDPEEPVDSMTVYYVNKAAWETVNAFVWTEGELGAYKKWPGEAMEKQTEKINELDVYGYTFPAKYVGIIFNDGTNQTEDLEWAATAPYFYDGKWYAKADIPAEGGGDDPQPEVKYYAKNNWEGASDWTWKEMTMKAEEDYQLECVFGGTGVNINTVADDEGQSWYAIADITAFLNDGEYTPATLGALDTVVLMYTPSEKMLAALILGKYVAPEPEEPEEPITVYFVNKAAWEDVNAFVWTDGEIGSYKEWPGEAMEKQTEKINELDVYAYTFPAKYVSIIFNDGTNQTEDLVWAATAPYFYDGKWYAKADIPAAGEEPEPELPEVAIAGSWDEKWTQLPMAKAEDELSASVKMALKAGNYDFKVVCGGAWLSKYGESGPNNDQYGINRSWPKADHVNIVDGPNFYFEADEEGEYTFVWTYADSTLNVTFPDKTVDPEAKYYMRNGWNGEAEWTWKEMTKQEDGSYKLEEVVFGGLGVDYNTTNETLEGKVWVALADIQGDEIAALDTVTLVLDPAKNIVTATLLGKYIKPLPVVAIAGSWDEDWKQIKMENAEDNMRASIVMVLKAGNYDFKVVSDDKWLSKYGESGPNEDQYGVNRSWPKADHVNVVDGPNFYFEADEEGEYTFVWTYADSTLNVTFPDKTVDPEAKYYMRNGWNGEAEWTWKEMTKQEDGSYKLEEVVFGGLGVDYNTTNETLEGKVWVALADFQGDEIAALDTVTLVLDPAKNIVTATLLGKYIAPDPEEPMTVYFVNKAAWENVNAFVWTDGEIGSYKEWPGEAMEKQAEKINELDVYAYTFPAKYVSIIFNNGTDQTANLAWAAAAPYFYDGQWYAKADIPGEGGGDDPQPINYIYTITGDSMLVGPYWDPTAEANDMAYDEEAGLYKLEKKNVALGSGPYYYKVVRDHAWGAGQYPADDGSFYINIEEPAIYTITFSYNPAESVLTALAEKTGELEKDVTVYFVKKEAWEDVYAFVWLDPTSINCKGWPGEKMELTESVLHDAVADVDYPVYSYSFSSMFNKIIFGNGDSGIGNQTSDMSWNKATPYYYDGVWYASLEAINPAAETKFYITGDVALVGAGNPWDPKAIKSLEDSYTLELAAGTYQLLVNLDGTVATSKGYGDLTNPAKGLTSGEAGSIRFRLLEAGQVVVTYKEVEEVVTFTVEGNFYTIEDGYYLAGLGKWTALELNAGLKFAENAMNPDEYVLTGMYLNEGDYIQAVEVKDNVIIEWFTESYYTVDANHAGLKDIYFKASYQADWAEFGGYIWIDANEPTGFENAAIEGKAVKMIQNGQVVILKGDKIYNVMGQIIR